MAVPCTASSPIEPPGKLLGCTTNESVDNTSRSPLGRLTTAPSPSGSSNGFRNASTKTASTSAAEAFPPAPCASVTCSSSSRAGVGETTRCDRSHRSRRNAGRGQVFACRLTHRASAR
ncbi:hypothetical protein I552_4760 [Mycobacterium xenopi 3993]|nr:hypothetical protein I552_4760 [Mycobacterium xenopi 3993]